MTSENQKLKMIHALNNIADQLDERWQTMSVKQVNDLECQIEKAWEIICRRSKRQD